MESQSLRQGEGYSGIEPPKVALFCFSLRLDNRQPISDNHTHTPAKKVWSGFSDSPIACGDSGQ